MKKKSNGAHRDPNLLERNDMTQKIDATVVIAICRTLGRTDWEMDEAMFKRGFWQPYDTGVYATLDQERTSANKLRRQVTVGLQELFERFGISP